jgi:hypothetical protein
MTHFRLMVLCVRTNDVIVFRVGLGHAHGCRRGKHFQFVDFHLELLLEPDSILI